MSGPQSNGLGFPGQDQLESLGDDVKEIALNGYRLSTAIVVIGVASFFVPFIFKGTVSTLKHVPSAIGEIARLPVRVFGWTRQVKEDYRTDDENKEKK